MEAVSSGDSILTGLFQACCYSVQGKDDSPRCQFLQRTNKPRPPFQMSHSASPYCLDKTQCLLYCAWCPIPRAQFSSQHPKLSLVSQAELCLDQWRSPGDISVCFLWRSLLLRRLSSLWCLLNVQVAVRVSHWFSWMEITVDDDDDCDGDG